MIRQGYFVAPVVPLNGLGLLGAVITKMEAVNVGDSCLLGAVITKMEAVNVGDSYWMRGVWEDGMWEFDTPMIKLIRQMEKT
jgi:hypothetical protein